MQRDDRMYFFVPCYRGLEYPWILISAWILEPMPRRYQGATKFLGSQKLTFGFLAASRSGPLTFALFKGWLYIRMSNYNVAHLKLI